MKTKLIIASAFTVFIIAFFSQGVCAAESYEFLANDWYKIAEKNYSEGQCVGASDAAKRALTYYTKDGNTEGVIKTTDLIGKISKCLKDTGDIFYSRALKNYTQKQYEDAIMWANKAKEQYDAIPDDASSEKAYKLAQDAQARIDEDQKLKADKAYTEGNRLYAQEDLLNSKVKAEYALEIYKAINDADGIKKAEALILAIENRKFEIKQVSDMKLRQATEWYKIGFDKKGEGFEDFVKAKQYAEEARNGYSKIGDKEKYNESVEILKSISGKITELETSFRNEANKAYDLARTEVILGDAARNEEEVKAHYNAAIGNFTRAQNMFYQLQEWAKDIYNTQKIEQYKRSVENCQIEINKVKEKLKVTDICKTAEEYFIDANTFFTKGECGNASIKARDAKSLFTKCDDQAGVFKTETLIYQINECLKKIAVAQSHLKNASIFFASAYFINATNETDAALRLYTEVKNEEGIKNATKFKEKIASGIENKTKADQLMVKANLDFRRNDFESSKNAAEQAQKIYTQLNYSEGRINATDLIKKNNEMIKSIRDRTTMEMTLTGGAILAAILVVAVRSYVKRSRKEKAVREQMERERKAKEEEEMRRRIEEEKAEAARLKELEAERIRLKAMIAEEMKKIELEKRSNM